MPFLFLLDIQSLFCVFFFIYFRLNEGFTQFNERKILGRLGSEKTRQLECILGLNDLRNAVEQFGHDSPYTNLVLKYALDDFIFFFQFRYGSF